MSLRNGMVKILSCFSDIDWWTCYDLSWLPEMNLKGWSLYGFADIYIEGFFVFFLVFLNSFSFSIFIIYSFFGPFLSFSLIGVLGRGVTSTSTLRKERERREEVWISPCQNWEFVFFSYFYLSFLDIQQRLSDMYWNWNLSPVLYALLFREWNSHWLFGRFLFPLSCFGRVWESMFSQA